MSPKALASLGSRSPRTVSRKAGPQSTASKCDTSAPFRCHGAPSTTPERNHVHLPGRGSAAAQTIRKHAVGILAYTDVAAPVFRYLRVRPASPWRFDPRPGGSTASDGQAPSQAPIRTPRADPRGPALPAEDHAQQFSDAFAELLMRRRAPHFPPVLPRCRAWAGRVTRSGSVRAGRWPAGGACA